MRKAEYPQRKCRSGVSAGLLDYSCELTEHHAGPCASFSFRLSVVQRDAWEAAHPDWEKLSVFDDPFGQVTP